MTASAVPCACQPWCIDTPHWNPADCSTEMLTVAATGARQNRGSSTDGDSFPGVTVRGAIAERDRSTIICLHLGDDLGGLDVEVALRRSEAAELIENLQLVLGQTAAR